jgi:Domain of unknown function (DUF1963)
MSALPPTILVSRQPRHIGENWTRARSWLGGAPKLGEKPWPRDKNGKPMGFMAQIDLRELHSKVGQTSLPDHGSLAFFIHPTSGRGVVGPVVFVSGTESLQPTRPPPDIPEPPNFGGNQAWPQDLQGQRLFPFWPADFITLQFNPSSNTNATDGKPVYRDICTIAAVEKHFNRPGYNLDLEEVFAGHPIPNWWQIAIQYAEEMASHVRMISEKYTTARRHLKSNETSLKETLDRYTNDSERRRLKDFIKSLEGFVSNNRAALMRMQEVESRFPVFSAEVSGFCVRRDPWSIMSEADLAQLELFWSRAVEFTDFHHNEPSFNINKLKVKVFSSLPANDSAAFMALPSDVRDFLIDKRKPRPKWWHMASLFCVGLNLDAGRSLEDVTRYHQNNINSLSQELNTLKPTRISALFGKLSGSESTKIVALEKRIDRAKQEVAKTVALEPAFKSFVEETNRWASNHDSFQLMEEADFHKLQEIVKRAKTEFSNFTLLYTTGWIEDLEKAALVALLTGTDKDYATLPEFTRNLVNTEFLLPNGDWHQMFGAALDIQGGATELHDLGYILLLQLTHDDLMQWRFGDNGCFQYWIQPDDLQNRNWSAVVLTFEGH